METLAEQKRLRIEQMRAKGIGKYATPGGGDAAPDASGGSHRPREPVAVAFWSASSTFGSLKMTFAHPVPISLAHLPCSSAASASERGAAAGGAEK